MEISTLLTADVLDIIFDGRNKEYGAYELRCSYKRRLALSIGVMLLVMLLLFIGFTFAGKKTETAVVFDIGPDPKLENIKEEKKEKIVIPPAAKPLASQVQVKTIRDVTFRIVNEKDVPETEKPPVNTDLTDVRIGNMTTDGVDNSSDFIAPPGDVAGKGIIEAPKKEDAGDDGDFKRVEIESEYPGGMPAWQRYLNSNLRFSQEAIDNEIQGAVVVQFIVDIDGTVSDVEAISGPEELRAEAVRVIKKSGRWTPAIQNGRKVKSYKKQPIVFRLQEN
jgi:periplasmic protein TonB